MLGFGSFLGSFVFPFTMTLLLLMVRLKKNKSQNEIVQGDVGGCCKTDENGYCGRGNIDKAFPLFFEMRKECFLTDQHARLLVLVRIQGPEVLEFNVASIPSSTSCSGAPGFCFLITKISKSKRSVVQVGTD
ncbi:hypothetical protein V6N11_044603 [Hibiscus sabdariffa]|uniref:Uncharacterized protein n=2 Tax=Hibiscus sabdariffa TaxID=183260 RepID=A0ABR2NBU6_9ROSI